MSAGFFAASENPNLPSAMVKATRSILRVDTGRRLHHRVFGTEAVANAWSGFVVGEDGVETFQHGWTARQIDALNLDIPGPDWAKGFRHELVVHLAAGGTLPYRTALTGFGTATLISDSGYLLTVQHLVTGPQRVHAVPERTFDPEGHPAPRLSVLTEEHADLGPVRLCYVDSALDLAVLKVQSPGDITPVSTTPDSPALHDRVWQWGYPHRTHRPENERHFLGYRDANHELRYTPGLVLAGVGEREWFTDGDATLGASGSAFLNDAGQLVGLYRGGGVRHVFPDDPLRYRRVIDAHGLKQDLPPHIFDA